MTEQNIPVPAETLRKLVASAVETASKEREKGYRYNMQSIQEASSHALERIGTKDGEYVSVNGHKLSTIVAYADTAEPEDIEVGRTYLLQYGIWDGDK